MLDCFRVVIVLFATLVVLPLSLKRSLQDLKWSSTISVHFLLLLFLFPLKVFKLCRWVCAHMKLQLTELPGSFKLNVDSGNLFLEDLFVEIEIN